MSALKPYLVNIYGIYHTVLLSDEDAAKRGLTEPVATRGVTVPNKMRTPETSRRGRKPLPRDADGNIVRDKADSSDD